MKCLIQRVACASVRVEHNVVGEIGSGLLVFIGVEPGDTDEQVARMAQRLLSYRLFGDAEGKMNLSVVDSRRQYFAGVPVHAGGRYGPGQSTQFFKRRPTGAGRALLRGADQSAQREWHADCHRTVWRRHAGVSYQ